jgi:hypothetical protein
MCKIWENVQTEGSLYANLSVPVYSVQQKINDAQQKINQPLVKKEKLFSKIQCLSSFSANHTFKLLPIA